MPRLSLLLVLCVLCGCVPSPQLDEAISEEARRADYPGFQPVDDLLAQAAAPEGPNSAAAIAALLDRATLLKARARILRQTAIVDDASQARMKAAYDRLKR